MQGRHTGVSVVVVRQARLLQGLRPRSDGERLVIPFKFSLVLLTATGIH